MGIYKRGKTYWCEFVVDKKRHQYSCKTKDKDVAEEVASAIHADIIRNRFNIQPQYKVKCAFKEIWREYLNGLSNAHGVLSLKLLQDSISCLLLRIKTLRKS